MAFTRGVAYFIALLIWVVAMLPIWIGAVGMMTLVMAAKITTGVMTGRDTRRGQTEFEELAAMWPNGFHQLVSGMRGSQPEARSAIGTGSWSRFIAICFYALLFWSVLAGIGYWFFGRS